jgi:hypothetical protein
MDDHVVVKSLFPSSSWKLTAGWRFIHGWHLLFVFSFCSTERGSRDGEIKISLGFPFILL